jgi:hypothetical protein
MTELLERVINGRNVNQLMNDVDSGGKKKDKNYVDMFFFFPPMQLLVKVMRVILSLFLSSST